VFNPSNIIRHGGVTGAPTQPTGRQLVAASRRTRLPVGMTIAKPPSPEKRIIPTTAMNIRPPGTPLSARKRFLDQTSFWWWFGLWSGVIAYVYTFFHR
jgi:hypothetical protein